MRIASPTQILRVLRVFLVLVPSSTLNRIAWGIIPIEGSDSPEKEGHGADFLPVSETRYLEPWIAKNNDLAPWLQDVSNGYRVRVV